MGKYPGIRTSAVFLCILFSAVGTFAVPSLSWANEIDSALVSRDSFFTATGFSLSLLKNGRLTGEQARNLRVGLDNQYLPANPWYNFSEGLLSVDSAGPLSAGYFHQALALSEKDPGTTWALFVEFTRAGQSSWAEKSLSQLEKIMLNDGVRAVPVVSQHLLTYARRQEQLGNLTLSRSYGEWARRFDPNQVWSDWNAFMMLVPSDPIGMIGAGQNLITTVKKSWIIQISLVNELYSWLRTVSLAFVLIIFILFCVKHLGKALHVASDWFPRSLNGSLRTACVVCVFFSFSAFGIIPFIWITLFLIWRFLSKPERTLGYFVAVVLVLAPCDSWVRSVFVEEQHTGSPVGLFAQALNEPYSKDFHVKALQRIRAKGNEPLTHLAAALYAMKCGEYEGSLKHISDAREQVPEDPVALLLLGDCYFLSNDIDKAEAQFNACIAQYPSNFAAHYNLANAF